MRFENATCPCRAFRRNTPPPLTSRVPVCRPDPDRLATRDAAQPADRLSEHTARAQPRRHQGVPGVRLHQREAVRHAGREQLRRRRRHLPVSAAPEASAGAPESWKSHRGTRDVSETEVCLTRNGAKRTACQRLPLLTRQTELIAGDRRDVRKMSREGS